EEYGGLRGFVLQTLLRNPAFYVFCLAGILCGLRDIANLAGGRRVALIFTIVITTLVFLHDQPWPYVFIMALPFLALWSLERLDRLADGKPPARLAVIVLGLSIGASFV